MSMKSTIFAFVALGLGAAGLSACNREAPKEEAAPDAKPGVTVSNGRVVLPAVSGNPGALYFDIVNNSDDYAVLRKAEVAGATETMMHDVLNDNGVSQMVPLAPVNLTKGETVKFEPGGKHIMAMDLDPALKAGGTVQVTLTFAGGDKLSFDAQVEAPGGAH